jgi:hypothetical protein
MNSFLPPVSAFSFPRTRWQGLCIGSVLAVVLLQTGCRRDEIQVYTVPKEASEAVPAVARGSSVPRARPQLSWTLPKDWRETGPGQMSVAGFSIKGSGDDEAQVTITPLAKLAGRDAEIVNMWRETVGQEPLSREEAAKQFTPVEVAGEPGNLFEISGTPEGSEPVRIVTAMVHRDDASWFYKLQGDAALVEAQKPVFIEFLKSVRFKEGPPDAETPPAAPKLSWSVPAQWKELPAGQMQVAKFAVPQRSGATGEVFVSVFPNDTGGLLANVNRWRNEIGLQRTEEGELGSLVSTLDPALPDIKLVDMTNNNRRLIAAIVPRGGSFWFYKLRGDAAAVTPERDAFLAFVKSTP